MRKPARAPQTSSRIGVAYLKLQRYAEARKYLLEALELHAYVGDRWGLAMTHIDLSQAGDGQPTAAQACGHESLLILKPVASAATCRPTSSADRARHPARRPGQRSGDPQVRFDPLGAVDLKGVAKPQPLYQAHRRS